MKKTLLLLTLSILTYACANKTQPAQTPPPNVLMISVDDLNTWLGCMGGYSNTKTPNMDKLASDGVLFTNAHCQAPLCGPSRTSIMAGLRPSTTGIYGMIHDNAIKGSNPSTDSVVFMPEFFREQGYHTMVVGKVFHSHAPDGVFDESGGRAKGFGPYAPKKLKWSGRAPKDMKGYGRTNTDWGAYPACDTMMPDHHSADWAIERLNRKHDKPFFMAVGFLRPHVPFYVPQKWFDKHPIEGIQVAPYKADDMDDIPSIGLKINDLPMMPSTEYAIESGEWKNIIQAYLACISYVDYEVGRVLSALENSDYANNTVVVLWSDHGYRMGEKGTFAKHALWEPATNAPLMFSAPNLPKGQVVNSPAEMLAIYPTLLDLCGLPAYEGNEGISLLPVMLDPTKGKDDVAITTFGWNNHSVRSTDFRYICYEDGGEELYDHRQDPNEWTNIASDPKYADVKAQLKAQLPQVNAPWDAHTQYNFQPYFKDQKVRSLAQ